jgi:hypothetical protein
MAQPPLGRSGGDKTTHVGYPMGQRKRKIKRGGGDLALGGGRTTSKGKNATNK